MQSSYSSWAYLTEWDSKLELNPKCCDFRVIIGRNFGITRKAACERVMRWLPPKRKAQFMVADQIDGFHPKAVFWKEEDGKCFAIVGSSNLTQAAFKSNYEANVFFSLSETDYFKGKKWVKNIETQSVVVSEDWLTKYKEARLGRQHGARGPSKGDRDTTPVLATQTADTIENGSADFQTARSARSVQETKGWPDALIPALCKKTDQLQALLQGATELLERDGR